MNVCSHDRVEHEDEELIAQSVQAHTISPRVPPVFEIAGELSQANAGGTHSRRLKGPTRDA